jgi:hypothetical protein
MAQAKAGGNARVTAEIAILNRSAVTLAADSAITLTVRGRQKIYDSADKIFELCHQNPVAVMIYNNLEFHDIPMEILVKNFRSEYQGRNFGTLFECCEAFLDFLRGGVFINEAAANRHVQHLLMAEYSGIERTFQEAIRKGFQKIKIKRTTNLHDLFSEVVSRRLNELQSMPVSSCFVDLPFERIVEIHREAISTSVERAFSRYPVDEADKGRLADIGALFLHRDVFSETLTGIVVAGFGSDEWFPSLQSVEIDGVIAGRLKRRITHKIDVDRNVSSDDGVERGLVKIIPFAQTDMAHRFLDGVDPDFERQLGWSVEKAVGEVLSKVVNDKTIVAKRGSRKNWKR